MSLISEVSLLFIESTGADTVANLIIASGLIIGIIRTTFLQSGKVSQSTKDYKAKYAITKSF